MFPDVDRTRGKLKWYQRILRKLTEDAAFHAAPARANVQNRRSAFGKDVMRSSIRHYASDAANAGMSVPLTASR